jgi:hypothetical protein
LYWNWDSFGFLSCRRLDAYPASIEESLEYLFVFPDHPGLGITMQGALCAFPAESGPNLFIT